MNEDNLDPVVAAAMERRRANFERRRDNDPHGRWKRIGAVAVIALAMCLAAALSAKAGFAQGVAGVVLLVVMLACGLTVYFVPMIVAHTRGHRNRLAIGVLNLFLGWTFVGWVIALVWACTSNTARENDRGL